MRGGIVAAVRVNPKDCQSILDVLQKAGIHTAGMSFAAMTALALQSLLEAARVSGTIPEPDEFQYLNRLQPYIKAKHGRKLEITRVLGDMGANIQAPPVTASLSEPRSVVADETPVHASRSAPAAPEDAEAIRMAGSRLTELLAIKDKCEDNVPGFVWTKTHEAEYQECYQILYPDG